jgi:hypothetical protein
MRFFTWDLKSRESTEAKEIKKAGRKNLPIGATGAEAGDI